MGRGDQMDRTASLLNRSRLGRVLLQYRLAHDLGEKPLPLWLIWRLADRRKKHP